MNLFEPLLQPSVLWNGVLSVGSSALLHLCVHVIPKDPNGPKDSATAFTFNPGECAWDLFPHRREDIQRVLEQGMFGLEDASWVARCLSMTIRITIEEGTAKKISMHQGRSVERDALYGEITQGVHAHLLFSWIPLNDGTGREVGHFDLLYPKQGPVAMLLLVDAPRPSGVVMGAQYCLATIFPEGHDPLLLCGERVPKRT